MMEKRFCKCGCGKEVKGWNYRLKRPIRFLPAHNIKGENHPSFGRKHTPESNEKNRQSQLKRFCSGASPWNKGVKGIHLTPQTEFKKGIIPQSKIHPEIMPRGDKHHNWCGGKSREPYGSQFNNALKRQVRQRDNHKCQLCGCPEMECKRMLTIHHIDYDKKNNNSNNLISICEHCHSKTNFNRIYFTNFFQEKMKQKMEV